MKYKITNYNLYFPVVPRSVKDADFRVDFLNLINKLSVKQKAAICLRFGFNSEGYRFTIKEISEMLGITSTRVRQLIDRATAKMRYTKSSFREYNV